MNDWQLIETAPKDELALFYVVPKSADEVWTDTSGKPIVSAASPKVCLTKQGQWGSLNKATHWMPIPPPPLPTSEPRIA